MAEPPLDTSPFDDLIGTEWLDDDPEHARARIAVRDDLLQPVGLLHGGLVSTLVESVCSRATALAVGMMNLWWMAALTAVVFIEQVSVRGEQFRIYFGIGLMIAGAIQVPLG